MIEMFKKKNTTFDVVIGEPMQIGEIKDKDQIRLLCQQIRQMTYSLKKHIQ